MAINYKYVPYGGVFSNSRRTGIVNFRGTRASFDIGTEKDYSDYLSDDGASEFMDYMSGPALERAKKDAWKKAQDTYWANTFAKSIQKQKKKAPAPKPKKFKVKPYKAKKLKIKTPKKSIPKAKTLKGEMNPKANNAANKLYLKQIKDLKAQLASQTKSSKSTASNFANSMKDLQEQMKAQMSGFQSSLASQAQGFSDQLAAKDAEYSTMLGDVNAANEKAMQTMAMQMSPQQGSQVMGIQGAVDPVKRLQMRRAGVSGQTGRQGIRLKSLNL